MEMISRRIKLFYMLFFFIIYTANLFANNPYIVNFDKKSYQAANKNWSIAEDERGIVYFGNDIGLLEFDGIEWNLSKMPNASQVRSITVLNHETVFTVGYEEFGRWDRDVSGRLVYTSLSDQVDSQLLKDNDFWKVWIVDGYVYFQSFSSLFVYDYKTVTQIPTNFNILFLLKVGDDLWMQEMKGPLYRLNNNKLDKVEGSDVFVGKDVRVILPYDSDKYLIGTATNGLYLYDGERFTEWNSKLSDVFQQNELNCGLLSHRGTYFLGSILNGIYEVDKSGQILNHFSTESRLQNNTILALHEDKLGNLWVALDRGIAYVQYLDNMSYFTDPSGNIGAVYDAVFWKDKLFLATNQGLFYISKDELRSSNSLSKLKLVNNTQGQVWSLQVIDDKLYCSHNRGLKIVNENMTITDYPYLNSGLYGVEEGRLKDQEVLLLSSYDRLRIIHKSTNKLYDIGRPNDPVRATEIDHLGNVWMQHPYKGVYRYMLNDSLTEVKNYAYYGGDSNDGLPYRLSMFKIGGRIILLGNDEFFTYDDIENKVKPNDKLNECFKSISNLKKVVYIGESLFWAISGDCVFKFYYDGYSAYIIERYDIGIHNLSLVDGYENISILDDSLSLICLDNGFLLYDKMTAKANLGSIQNIPHLESFQINNMKGDAVYLNLSEKAEVPYNYNSVTVSFTVNDIFSKNLSFQYMLDGVDQDWSSAQEINKITYDRLPKGHYVLMIRTIDNLGNYSDTLSYEFQVLSPWYQTIWAYFGYFILFVILFFIVWQIMLKRYRNIHLQKVRLRETKRLRAMNEKLQFEIEKKNAELFTQTSFIIQKNELILKTKEIVDEFYHSSKNKMLDPLYQRIGSLLSNNLNREDDWKMFLIKFEQKHPNFFKQLKTLYPELTTNDLKLCACLKLNLDSKEIASFMNLSVRAVENSRSRLRKKLNIPTSMHLSDFLFSID
ncbi:triple tyrosine motif-containing protein [Dysgonomonas sp. ZJ279]|uniref:triple tyrosine motif-containing protein n=1 Tax=Dysgonomonas sp. ZJ279 TaxID=2709796 RepID=UPI002106C314|nr:triple tyrosine motif-containing protein [Dysgonomonas sp. ZJ279]